MVISLPFDVRLVRLESLAVKEHVYPNTRRLEKGQTTFAFLYPKRKGRKQMFFSGHVTTAFHLYRISLNMDIASLSHLNNINININKLFLWLEIYMLDE